MDSEATRVLVTGGAGFIGAQLCRALSAAGHAVRVFDDFSTGTRDRLSGLPLEILAADVRNAAAVRRALVGVQVVYHLAGVSLPSSVAEADLLRAEEVNVGGALNLLQGAQLARTARVVLVSSGAVYGRANAFVLHEDVAPLPVTLEAVQHLAVEQHARVFHEQHRVPSVVLRLFRTFGPGERTRGADLPLVPALCQAALDGRGPRLVAHGQQVRDLVYVDNAVRALIAAGSARDVDGRTFNIASGEPVTVSGVWRTIAALAGLGEDPPEPSFVPPPPVEPGPCRVSIARACRELGYVPEVLLRTGLRRTLEHHRNQRLSTEHGWFTPPSAPAPPRPSPPTPPPRPKHKPPLLADAFKSPPRPIAAPPSLIARPSIFPSLSKASPIDPAAPRVAAAEPKLPPRAFPAVPAKAPPSAASATKIAEPPTASGPPKATPPTVAETPPLVDDDAIEVDAEQLIEVEADSPIGDERTPNEAVTAAQHGDAVDDDAADWAPVPSPSWG